MLFYRLLVSLAAPFLLAVLVGRVVIGRERVADLSQRLGGGTGQPGAIWLHGASNGELTSARPLIEALRAAFPDRPLIVTANTLSGRDMVAGWGLCRVRARLAPLDLRWILARFRRRWRPAAGLSLENELWLNRIVTSRAPVLAVSARLSQRSAARWRRVPGPMRVALNHLTRLYPQDASSAQRFVSLGLDPARLAPVLMLKKDAAQPPPPERDLVEFRALYFRPDTILAASTHEGEEAVIAHAFALARRRDPALKLILAPRHPRRAAAVAALIRAADLSCATRSRGDRPGPDTAVYLADTLGEMPLWYALAGITFVGGSLVPRGGHTPYEPASAGSAIVHGPHVGNFETAYAALDAGGGARTAADAQAIVAGFMSLRSAAAQADQARRAELALSRIPGAEQGVAEIVGRLGALLAKAR